MKSLIESHSRKRRALASNAKLCSGCRTCELVCSITHEGIVDFGRSRIYVKSNPFKGSFVPVVCHQCFDFPCLKACPESAIQVNEENGTVLISSEKCTGCWLCQEACPFDAIRFDGDRGTAFKCDLCQGDPECVKWCPSTALGIVEFGGRIPT